MGRKPTSFAPCGTNEKILKAFVFRIFLAGVQGFFLFSAPHVRFYLRLCAAKAFGHRSKTTF